MPDEKLGAGASAAQPLDELKEQPAPGPDDVVTVTVGGKDKQGLITRTVEVGAGKDTHPEGSGEKPTAARMLKSDVEMPSL